MYSNLALLCCHSPCTATCTWLSHAQWSVRRACMQMQVRQHHEVAPTPETQCAGCRSGVAKDHPAPCRSGSSAVDPAGRGHRYSASWWTSRCCKSTDTIRTGRVRLSHSPCGPPTLTPDHPPTTCHFHGIIALCFALAGDCSRNQQPASQCWAAEGIDTADPKFRELQRPCSGRSRLFRSIACR